MSEPKFTPGPWEAYQANPGVEPWWQIRTGEQRGVYPENQETARLVLSVGRVQSPGLRDDGEVMSANAHLIAAAPDLYAALEKAFALVEALMPGLAKISVKDYRAVNETPSEIRAALAKARGETAGCPLDTDGDGNCHAHPAGCPPLIRGLLAFLAISLVISCTSVSKRANPQHWRREQQLAAAAGCCLLWNPCSFMGFPPHLTNSSLMHAQSSKEDQ